MDTWHIHIEGQVQGVGFRPFVFLLAHKFGLEGWVNNTIDGVHVVFNAKQEQAELFAKKIIERAPELSLITRSSLVRIDKESFLDFRIIESVEEGQPALLLTPDFGICDACRHEIKQPINRRFGYPFTTCTNCGPRFSIMHKLPYDRFKTTMSDFGMCPECHQEFNNPSDRRYYSQTNSCCNCGISISLYDANQNLVSSQADEIVEAVVQKWEDGKIVAIKGIGGYLLTCDAGNKTAVLELRKRKNRPSKPFAIMIPSTDYLKVQDGQKSEIAELDTYVSPIVLMTLSETRDLVDEIAPYLNQTGVMLPYAPLFELLMDKFGKAIVCTSGNASGSPIVFRDDIAVNELSSIADFVLVHNRAILLPQDDSVLKFSFFKNQKIVLRRSRGLAPTNMNPNLELSDRCLLATGAMLKSTFSLLHQRNMIVSQYIGDLIQFHSQENYKYIMRHILGVFGANPTAILSDKHRDYPSTRYGMEMSQKLNVPIHYYQHHIAHFGAIIGEHNLLHEDENVLGVIWDGTGLGDDGNIWGGEFFKYNNYEFKRCQQFEYFDFILGDKMPKEPRISALSACWGVEEFEDLLKPKFSSIEWRIYSKLLENTNHIKTSSVGRIFDAVSSLLGIMDIQTFEGEAAMRLENLALEYFVENEWNVESGYLDESVVHRSIPTKLLMDGILRDMRDEREPAFISAKFHHTLAMIVKRVALDQQVNKVAFSGGVFQNGLLVDLIIHHLGSDFELYFHDQLSPNDENISFGQVICFHIENQKELFNKKKSNEYVFSNSR